MITPLASNNHDIPDAIRRGLGAAARAVGAWCDLYRPRGVNAPMNGGNRLLQLPAAFANPSNLIAPVGYGDALWEGYFDAGYSRPGDYVAGPDGVFFIASQPRLGPVLCVRTNRVLSFSRPAAPLTAGVNRYMGVQLDTATPLLQDWPASVLAAGVGGRGPLPSDAPGVHGGSGGWAVLLPAVCIAGVRVVLRAGDLLHDDLARTGVIASAELTDLGWRLHVRQAAS
jgi:hypothetical protein